MPRWLRKTKVANKMGKMLVNHLGLNLTKEDLENVVDLMEPYGQISNGIELLNPPVDWTRETKFPHAVWAAGRALIALLIPNFDVVDNLWLEPSSWEGIGCTKITKVTSGGSASGNTESRSYLEKKLVFCFGSHIASQMLLPPGEENFLSSSEITQAQEVKSFYSFAPTCCLNTKCTFAHMIIICGMHHRLQHAWCFSMAGDLMTVLQSTMPQMR